MAKTSYVPGTFARFFRAVEGRLVSRYGTGGTGPGGWRAPSIIGGSRPAMTEKEASEARLVSLNAPGCRPAVLDLAKVTAITFQEAEKFSREYDRAVREESLLEVSEKAYIAYLEKQQASFEKELAKNEKLKKARDDAAKRERELSKAAAAKAATKASRSAARPETSPENQNAGSDADGDGESEESERSG